MIGKSLTLVDKRHSCTQNVSIAVLSKLSDEDLMLRYQGGDVQAFELLFERHSNGIFVYILRMTHRPSIAEELLQDTFVKVIKAAPRYKKWSKFTTWIYKIARNACIDFQRKQKIRDVVSLDNNPGSTDDNNTSLHNFLPDEGAFPDDELGNVELRQAIVTALADLPPEQRETFLLREISGMPFNDIADIMDVSVNTVKSRMRYALKHLQNNLTNWENYFKQ